VDTRLYIVFDPALGFRSRVEISIVEEERFDSDPCGRIIGNKSSVPLSLLSSSALLKSIFFIIINLDFFFPFDSI